MWQGRVSYRFARTTDCGLWTVDCGPWTYRRTFEGWAEKRVSALRAHSTSGTWDQQRPATEGTGENEGEEREKAETERGDKREESTAEG